MIKKDNFWIDDNKNKWDCDLYNKYDAVNYSKTLANCRGCSNCSNCSNCRCCRDCSNCIDCRCCRDCIGCSDFSENPQRYVTKKIGSCTSQTTIYWIDDNIHVACGCFIGTLIEFQNRVRKTYPDESNEYRLQYEKEIKIMKYLIGGGE